MTPPLLSIRDVSKRFGETVALADAGLDLHAGEVHALLGANGSGKSTLIKILAGVEQGDAGEITVVGREVRAQDMNPTIAHDCHLRFVHQQGSTFGSLSVAENLAAGTAYPRRRFGRIDWRRLRREARATLQRFGVDADPAQPMESLRPATQQMVTITRLLQSQPGAGGGVLVLDEPTAALARPEVVLLHDALRRFAGAGHSILYVTHRLDELAGFVDRATVLREGRVVGRLGADEIDHERLVELIAGALLEVEVAAQQARAVGPSEERLRLRDLRGGAIERETSARGPARSSVWPASPVRDGRRSWRWSSAFASRRTGRSNWTGRRCAGAAACPTPAWPTCPRTAFGTVRSCR